MRLRFNKVPKQLNDWIIFRFWFLFNDNKNAFFFTNKPFMWKLTDCINQIKKVQNWVLSWVEFFFKSKLVWLPLHTRQIVLLNAGPQVIYGRGNVFAARIHYHTAVGLSAAPSSLSKINTRNKRGRFEVTCVKALEVRRRVKTHERLVIRRRRLSESPSTLLTRFCGSFKTDLLFRFT